MGIRILPPVRSKCTWLAAASIALVLLAYLLRALYSDADPLSPMTNADAASYWEIAGTLATEGRYAERKYFFGEDRSLELRSWRPPVTAVILIPFRRLGLEPEQVRVFYWVILAATAAMLWACAAELLPQPPALNGYGWVAGIAPLLYLTHLQTMRAAGVLGAEIPFVFLFAACLWLVLKATGDGRLHKHKVWGLAFTAGALAGLALLSRTVMVAALPGIVGLLLARAHNTSAITALRSGAMPFLLGLLLVAGSWQLRNAAVHDHFVFVASSSGYNLYKGILYDDTIESSVAILKRGSAALDKHGESAASGILTREALRFALDNPGRFANGAIDNVVLLWGPRRGLPRYSWRWWYTIITQTALLGIAVSTLFVGPSRRSAYCLLAISVLLTALHAVTFVGPRFVMPVLLPCYLLASYAASLLLPAISATARKNHD